MVVRPISLKRLLLRLAAGLLLAACQPAGPAGPASSPGQLRVVATFSILGDLVQNVAGDRIALTVLVGPDGDAHSYEPAPADTRALAEAALIIENGLEFEGWLDDLYTSSGSQAARVAVSDGITPLEAGEQAGEDEHGHGEFDPHLWQSVPNAIQMVRNIAAALAAADPANAAAYRANADAYLAQLDELQRYIENQVASLPAERRKLVTNHDTFAYFAQAYGFTIVGDALGAISTEGGEPSAAQMAQLADLIRAEGVPALFAENVEGSQVIERLAQETGVKIGPPLYTDALSRPGASGDTYLRLMRYNVDSIVGALR